jgi:hypothetical protein
MQAQLQQALALLRQAKLDLTTLTNAEIVALGQALWDIGNQARELLAPIKAHLQREAASKREGQPGKVRFDGPSGARCTVTIPPAHVAGRPRVSFNGRLALGETDAAPMIRR